ncbi:MAG: hypothetical protein GY696_37810, partial [Gammaproteobacteria bacterium]|nr:hypothetical protein [Gammaproteobacteria bacterium]
MISGMAAAAMASIAAKKKNKPSKENGDQKPEAPTSYYVCEHCPAMFNRRYNRDRHVELVHKMPRPGKPPLFPKTIKDKPKDERVKVVPLKRSRSTDDLTTSPDLQSMAINSEPKKTRLNLSKASEQPEIADNEEEDKTDANNECKAQEDNVNVIQFP